MGQHARAGAVMLPPSVARESDSDDLHIRIMRCRIRGGGAAAADYALYIRIMDRIHDQPRVARIVEPAAHTMTRILRKHCRDRR